MDLNNGWVKMGEWSGEAAAGGAGLVTGRGPERVTTGWVSVLTLWWAPG